MLAVGIAGCNEAPSRAAIQEGTRPAPTSVVQVLEEASEIDGLLCLLAKQDGRLVVEGYFDGATSDQLRHLRSGTKSVTSLLVGIALDQGLLTSIDLTLGEILGPRVERFGAKKAALPLRHLLTMTAGLDWDESTVEEYNRWRVSRDPLAHYLERSVVADPGDTWAYSSGASHVLSAVVGEVTGSTARDYAEKSLFAPLEIRDYRWEAVAGGDTNGAAGLELKPGDALKLGELLLGRGSWSGRRVVSEEWIAVSTQPHVKVNGDTHYGYQWWISVSERAVAWTALGHAGQLIAVFPDSDVVIVANSRWQGLNRPASDQINEVLSFIRDRLAPFLIPDLARS